MTWLAQVCILSFGWRRALLMLVAGALAALSMPPLFLLPALFLALPLWVWCLDGAESATGIKRLFGPAFAIGFFFGLGYFGLSIHWVGAAFFVDGGIMLVLMPLAVFAMAAALAVFWGLASAFAHLFWTHSPTRIVILAIALGIAEFARGHLLTGFPFDLLGYALTANDTMMQLASVVGIYGLTFIAALIAFTPALIWPADERALSLRLVPLFAALAMLALQLGFGQYRLNNTPVGERDDMRLRLIQPNISQAQKWQADSRQTILERLLELSATRTGPNNAGLTGITHLVWPESALPFFLSDYPGALVRIADLLPPGTTLLTGMPRRDFLQAEEGADYNSIFAINSDGEILSTYDKTHLVPVGEYLPFKSLFQALGIQQFVPGARGWTAGESRRLMQTPQTPAFFPLICYESLFSGDLGADISNAQFILNVTNDGWFDGSIGPEQLFHHARIRAVEQGLPMVRVANSGLTAMIDPLGRITGQLAPSQSSLIDVNMPTRLEATIFSRWTNWPFLIMLAIAALWAGLTTQRKIVSKNI